MIRRKRLYCCCSTFEKMRQFDQQAVLLVFLITSVSIERSYSVHIYLLCSAALFNCYIYTVYSQYIVRANILGLSFLDLPLRTVSSKSNTFCLF